MARDNVELVLTALQAGAARPPDFETVNRLYHADHVFVPVVVGTTEAKGAAGYKAWLEENQRILPWTMAVEGANEVTPERVLAEPTMQFRGATSDIGIEQRLWLAIEISDGKIVRTEAYLDRDEALRIAEGRD